MKSPVLTKTSTPANDLELSKESLRIACQNLLTETTDWAKLQNHVPYTLSWSQREDEDEDLNMAHYRLENYFQTLRFYDRSFKKHISRCKEANLPIDEFATGVSRQLRSTISNLIKQHDNRLNQPSRLPSEHFQKMSQIDQIYRSLLNVQVSTARVLSWTAQAYQSSKLPLFFDSAKTKKEAVNYDRVQSPRVNFIEKQLMHLYGFNNENVELLLTCSGTAAYNILEKYLAIHVLKQHDRVLVAPTMYDEHQDWAFRDNPTIEVITKDIFDAAEIVKCIQDIVPKVVFIDPLKNRQDARMTDVLAILHSLRDSWHGEEIYFVIDDTMVAAALDPFRAVESNPKLKILLCSSNGKYLEIGQDTCMAGLIAYPKEMSKRMKNIRMFHGSILSDAAAWSYPFFDRKYYSWRMRRMTRNALIFAEIFSQCDELKPYFQPVFPALPDHPDFQVSKLFPFLGGTVNLRLIPYVLNPKETLHDTLDEMIVSIIEQAKSDGVSICWGEAVGFSIPRISVHLEWLWRVPPYLRLVAGDRSLAETKQAIRSIIGGLTSYIKNNRDKFLFNTEAAQIAESHDLYSQLAMSNTERENMSFFR